MPKNKTNPKRNTMVRKEIIVLGDIEMGAGNLTDDFIADKSLSNLILSCARNPNPVDLVLNGDTFDFLKCPYTITPKPAYTPYITAQVALSKVKLVAQAHPLIFRALREFTRQKNKVIYFIRGNHDFELAFDAVQQEIRKRIGGNDKNILFPGLCYDKDGVYIEHGHEYDHFNKTNKPFADYKKQKILNNPFISLMIIHAFAHFKENHPFLERIKPIPTLFSVHPIIRKKVNQRVLSYVLKSIFYYPLIHFRNPLHAFPTAFLQQFLKEAFSRIVSGNMETFEIISSFKKAHPEKQGIIILSHIHETHIKKSANTTIIHPDSWRDEYLLNPKTKKLMPKPKRYVHVTLKQGNTPSWKLRTFKTKRKILDFTDVVKHEHEHIKRVAEEEKDIVK